MFSFMIISLIIVYTFLIKCKEAPLFLCFIFNKNRLRRPDSVIFGWITWLLFKLRVYSWMTVGPISRLSLPVTVAVRLSVPSVCPSRGRLPTSWGAFRDRQTMNAARPLSSSSNSPVVPLILSASPATSNRLLLSDVCVWGNPVPLPLPHRVRALGEAPLKLHGASFPCNTHTKRRVLSRTPGGGVSATVGKVAGNHGSGSDRYLRSSSQTCHTVPDWAPVPGGPRQLLRLRAFVSGQLGTSVFGGLKLLINIALRTVRVYTGTDGDVSRLAEETGNTARDPSK